MIDTYVLQQVNSINEVSAKKAAVGEALKTRGIAGSSWRIPWSAITDNLLNAIADAAGAKPFVLRFMAGRHTPPTWLGRSFVYNGAETNGQGAGSKIPVPFMPNGGPNVVFEDAWKGEVSHLAAFSRAHGCPVLHLPWPGLLWSELALVAQELTLPGYSMQAVVDAHVRLMRYAASQAGPDLSVEFPISGHCPMELRARIIATVKADPTLANVLIQSNNLDSTGQGIPAPGDGVRRGLQMVGMGDYDWPKVFQIAQGFESLEVYTPSFSSLKAADLADCIYANSYLKSRIEEVEAELVVAQAEVDRLDALLIALGG